MTTSHMQHALTLANKAFQQGEIPVGALIVRDNHIIAEAFNTRESQKNPLQHAEILCLEQAAKQKGDWRLNDCTLIVTLEPCPMCLGALLQARIKTLVFGAFDTKRFNQDIFPSLKTKIQNIETPFILSSNNHNLEIYGGILEDDSAHLLKTFFQQRREK